MICVKCTFFCDLQADLRVVWPPFASPYASSGFANLGRLASPFGQGLSKDAMFASAHGRKERKMPAPFVSFLVRLTMTSRKTRAPFGSPLAPHDGFLTRFLASSDLSFARFSSVTWLPGSSRKACR